MCSDTCMDHVRAVLCTHGSRATVIVQSVHSPEWRFYSSPDPEVLDLGSASFPQWL